MEYIGIKLSIPNKVATVGASAHYMVSSSPSWEVRLGLGWTMVKGVNGVAT